MSRREFAVLVVEDHAATAHGLRAFLELAGYTVHIAADMTSALKIAEKTSFDVLVCDLNLPDGTGWELMEGLRKKAPVRGIVFSAFDEPEHVARSRAAGFDEHVVKGTTPEALLAAIDRVAKFELPPEANQAQAANDSAPAPNDKQRKRPMLGKRRPAAAKAKSSR